MHISLIQIFLCLHAHVNRCPLFVLQESSRSRRLIKCSCGLRDLGFLRSFKACAIPYHKSCWRMALTLRQAFSSPLTSYPSCFLIILKLRRGPPKVNGMLSFWVSISAHRLLSVFSVTVSVLSPLVAVVFGSLGSWWPSESPQERNKRLLL